VEMTRLAAECADKSGEIAWSIEGGQTRQGYPMLTLSVSGTVQLVCQRCLTPFGYALDSSTVLVLGKDDAEADEIASVLFNQHADRSVGQHHAIAAREFINQAVVVADELAGAGGDFAAHKPQFGAFDARDFAAMQLAQADFRPAQIGQHPDRPPELAADAADRFEHGLVLFQFAVRHVQAEDVDAGFSQRGQLALFAACGADSGDDLGADATLRDSGVCHQRSRERSVDFSLVRRRQCRRKVQAGRLTPTHRPRLIAPISSHQCTFRLKH